MRVTITNDEGTIFFEHTLGTLACAHLLAYLVDAEPFHPDDEAAEAQVGSFLLDLAAASRNTVSGLL